MAKVSQPKFAVATSDQIPIGWNLSEIAKASFPKGPLPVETKILTWQIVEDDRPLYIEKCIVWFRFFKNGYDFWRLSNLYRHPKKSPRDCWEISMVCDAPQLPEADFNHPPSARELDQFLTDTWWHFHPKQGFRLIDSAICTLAWEVAIGNKPTQTYSFVPKNSHD